MAQVRTVAAKHILAHDVIGSRVVETVRYVSGEVLVFYQCGGQQLFPLNALVTIRR
jgi:hypothetical protein